MTTPRLRLGRGWVTYQGSGGFHLIHLVSNRRYRLHLPAGGRRAFDALREGVELSDHDTLAPASALPGLAADTAATLLRQLDRIGALVRHELPVPADALYSRQIRYFLLFERDELSAVEMLDRLQRARVVVVGLGGLGSWLLLALARIGVRSLVGVDGDVVERSNLSRQVLFDLADVGHPKALRAARVVQAVDPGISYQGLPLWVRSPADLVDHLAGADLLVNPFGYPFNQSLRDVEEAAWQAGVPTLLLGGSWIGPLHTSPASPCYRCLCKDPELADVIAASQSSFMGSGADDEAGGPFAPRIAATASVAANEIALYLSGARRPRSAEGVVVLDLFDFDNTTVRAVPVDPSCRCQAVAAAATSGSAA